MDPIFASLTGGLKFKGQQNRKIQQLFDKPATKAIAPAQTPERLSAAAARKKHRLNLVPSPADDPTLPDPIQSFDDLLGFVRSKKAKGKGKAVDGEASAGPRLGVSKEAVEAVLKNMKKMGWETPTPVQMQAVPLMLAGRDLLAQASTGSGKTLAFLIPLLLSLPQAPSAPRRPRTLIVEPTRELARQVCAVARALAGEGASGWKIAVLGEEEDDSTSGDESDPEDDPEAEAEAIKDIIRNSPSRGLKRKRKAGRVPSLPICDILISTPLRLIYHLKSHSDSLAAVRHVVLDEADQLLAKESFLEQTDLILSRLPKATPEDPLEVRKHLFSATLPSSIEQLATTFLSPSLSVRLFTGGLSPSASSTPLLTQRLDFVNTESSKLPHLRLLVAKGGLPPPVLVFVQSPQRAEELSKLFNDEGWHADHMHGGKSVEQRDATVRDFISGKTWFLVSTDVFSRGLDFKGVKAVVNYDFPQSAVSYIHRIGRAGRGNTPGTAITLFTLEDAPFLRTIVNVMRNSGCEVPEWMVKSLPKVGKKERKRLKTRPVERVGIKKAASMGGGTTKAEEERRMGKKKQKAKAKQAKSGVDLDDHVEEAEEAGGDEDDDGGGWLPAGDFNDDSE